MKSQYELILKKYIPENAVSLVVEWIIFYGIHLKITKERHSKLGDFRPSAQIRGHRITVNHNLNPYAFLLTLVHEIAHLDTWNKYSNRVKPHGQEWKFSFNRHMQPFLEKEIFPEEIRGMIIIYMNNPAASSCTDHRLSKALRQFDNRPMLILDEIPTGSMFKIGSGRVFKKGEKRRKRYHCMEIGSEQAYLISAAVEVELIS